MVEGFESFYAEHRDDVVRAVFAVTGERDLTDEAVSEAFTRACARWSRVRAHPNPVAWVAKTAINEVRSAWRRRSRAARLTVGPEPIAREAELTDSSVVASVLSLPLRQRQVVALRILLDLSTEQTARALGIAPGTVTAHLHRALSALETRLSEEVMVDED
jgi:RNA polymerase sigma-70 factor (ECF subfamily)